MEAIPSTRDTARALGLVTIAQMVATIVNAVEAAPTSERTVGVPEIRRAVLT
jgi:hypothetical protein